jgi:hypothetical protein
MAAAAGMRSRHDHLPATVEEHFQGFTLAASGLGCGDGFALELNTTRQIA